MGMISLRPMIHKELFWGLLRRAFRARSVNHSCSFFGFPLDICGNPTTLGCQMTSDPVRPTVADERHVSQGQHSSVMGRQIRAEAKSPQVGKIEGKRLYSYGIML